MLDIRALTLYRKEASLSQEQVHGGETPILLGKSREHSHCESQAWSGRSSYHAPVGQSLGECISHPR